MEAKGLSSLLRSDLVRAQYGHATNLAFNELIKSRMAKGEEIYHFGFGQSPFPVMAEARSALARNAHRNEYLAVQGIPELRQAICSFHEHFDQLTFDPGQVIVAPGSKELILLLMTVFNGDILMNSPSWTTYRPQAVLAGKTTLLVDSCQEGDWKVTPQALEKVLTSESCAGHHKLLIFTNPCNPTGTCYSEAELAALTVVFRKHNVTVLSDEIYARLVFDGDHTCLAKVYPEGTILSAGLSKWASAGGWRVGYHIFPTNLFPLLNIIRSAASHSYSCAPAPMQLACVDVFQNLKACEEYIQHCRRILNTVADFTVSQLQSVGVSVVKPRAGYYAFPNFEVIRSALSQRGVSTGKEMCELILDQVAVALLPGGPDHLRPSTELTVRLCFIDFDGQPALQESRRLGLDSPIGLPFVKEFCPKVFKGINALKDFVIKLKGEQSTLST